MKVFYFNDEDADRKWARVTGASRFHADLVLGDPILPNLSPGESALNVYKLDEDAGGLKVGDYFPNTDTHLPLRRSCADAILADFKVGPYELIPAQIINSKGRIHADDIVILNPLGRINCLDWDNSELDDDQDDPTVRIFGRWSLKAKLVPSDRDIFRVKGLIGYLFSERLVNFIAKRGFEPFGFEPAALT
jgi:hypothetical protein